MTQPRSAERGAHVRFPPPLVFVGFTLLGVFLQYIAAPLRFPESGWIRVIGIFILLAGLALMVWAVMAFRRTGQDIAPWTPSPELISLGPYLWTRNPMYVGMTWAQIGLGLALNNLWVSLLAPFALLVVHFIAVLPEEKYLAEKFGTRYGEYRSRVRRYL